MVEDLAKISGIDYDDEVEILHGDNNDVVDRTLLERRHAQRQSLRNGRDKTMQQMILG